MLVMIGASASGKTEIAKIIIQKYGFEKMVTYTTRSMRLGETNGVDYHFISDEEFHNKMKNAEFLETTQYNNHLYGTALKNIGDDKVLIVDVNGANVLHNALKDQAVFFYLQAPKEIRMKRMLSRGDHLEDIKRRLKKDEEHFVKEHIDQVDYVINTDTATLDQLANQIYTIYQETISQKRFKIR
jgi:guanylate kinase